MIQVAEKFDLSNVHWINTWCDILCTLEGSNWLTVIAIVNKKLKFELHNEWQGIQYLNGGFSDA